MTSTKNSRSLLVVLICGSEYGKKRKDKCLILIFLFAFSSQTTRQDDRTKTMFMAQFAELLNDHTCVQTTIVYCCFMGFKSIFSCAALNV